LTAARSLESIPRMRAPAPLPLLAVAVVLLAACSGGGSSGNCPAGKCQSIADQIRQHGGGNGTCNEPTPQFEAACQSYVQCQQQCPGM
jgi:hypothetical protein